MSKIDSELTTRVADFLFEEACRLDDRRYREWLDLYTDDAIYWVPANDFEGDPSNKVSIYYDDQKRLKERIARMESPDFSAQNAPSRTCRLVNNIRVIKHDDRIRVDSKFILVELRHGVSNTFAGSYRHRLSADGDSFRIHRKDVFLIQNNEPFYNLTFIF